MQDETPGTDFEKAGERARNGGPLREFWFYLTHSGKWWMVPIIASLVMIGGVIVLGGTSAAPIIYALF